MALAPPDNVTITPESGFVPSVIVPPMDQVSMVPVKLAVVMSLLRSVYVLFAGVNTA